MRTKSLYRQVLVLGVASLIVLTGIAARAAEISEGTLTGIRGQMEVKKRGGKSWIVAFEGMRIAPGDQVSAGIDGYATLILKDSRTDIQPLTEFVIGRCIETEKENYSEMFLQIGQVSAKVNPLREKSARFNVITPTSVAGVRGTRMVISHFPGVGTSVNITEGLGFVTLATAQNVPAAAHPLLGIVDVKKEKEEKKEKETKNDKKQEKAEKKSEKKTDRSPAADAPAVSNVTTQAAVDIFNSFLTQMEQSIGAGSGTEKMELLDARTFEYVVEVSRGQRISVGATAGPGAQIMTPSRAMEKDAQTSTAPEGLSSIEVQAIATSVEATGAPESVGVKDDASSFAEANTIATVESTALGGVPPSSKLEPPAFPDRTGKTNLTNSPGQ